MPEGEFTAKVAAGAQPPAGEAYAASSRRAASSASTCSPTGALTPYRMRLRPPALLHLSVVDEALAGGLIADAVVTIGSLDIVLGEIDR